MSTKSLLGLIGCLVAAFCFSSDRSDLRASQGENPALAAQDANTEKAASTATNSVQEDLKKDLEAVFKVQLHALELQKRQLEEDLRELTRQIKEQEAEAISQLKVEFERQTKAN